MDKRNTFYLIFVTKAPCIVILQQSSIFDKYKYIVFEYIFIHIYILIFINIILYVKRKQNMGDCGQNKQLRL